MRFARSGNAHQIHERHCQPLVKHGCILRVVAKYDAFQSQERLVGKAIEIHRESRLEAASAASAARANTDLLSLNVAALKNPVKVRGVMRVLIKVDLQVLPIHGMDRDSDFMQHARVEKIGCCLG
jgi:hypothetical protein